jgi:lipoate---protein ligase
MKIVVSPSKNPFFNLALEERLFQIRNEDFFILYINEPSVICGKHQIPYKEADIEFAEKHQIFMCRRFSGGGTVYHDPGNLNFCFITNNDKSNIEIDFRKFTRPVFDFLTTMGLSVTMNERNNILLNGKKISGNAEHISKGRILHHGTLLFDCDLSMMNIVLKNDYSKYTDNSVKSVRASVTNILPFLSEPINIRMFRNSLVDFMISRFNTDFFKPDEQLFIDVYNLSLEKYSTYDWIYGYSPDYELRNTIWVNKTNCEFSLQVKKGVIQSYDVTKDFKNICREILSRAVEGHHSTENFDKILSRMDANFIICEKSKTINKYCFF